MMEIYLVDQRISAMALYFSGRANQTHVLFVTARLMPCVNTWGFSL
jgi:hypothetical protein